MKSLRHIVIELSLEESEYNSFKEIVNKITESKTGFKITNLTSDEIEMFNKLKDELWY